MMYRSNRGCNLLVRCHLTCSKMAILLTLLDEEFAAAELTEEARPVVCFNSIPNQYFHTSVYLE